MMTFHFIWVGSRPLPDAFQRNIDGWKKFHPESKIIIWKNEHIPYFTLAALINKLQGRPAQQADVMRYEILYRYGGVYCDVDLECLKSIVTLLPKTETDPVMILCNENDDRSVTYCSNSWIAVTSSHHPALEKIMDRLSSAEYQSRILHSNCGANETTGPHLLGWGISEELKNITILPRIYFYPFLWYNKDAKDRNGPFPDSYAIHHWAESWKN